MASPLPRQLAIRAANLQFECTNLASNKLTPTDISAHTGQGKSGNLVGVASKVTLHLIFMLGWLLLAPGLLWVVSWLFIRHLDGISVVLAILESVISSIALIVSALTRAYNLVSWVTTLGYIGSTVGLAFPCLTLFALYQYPDKYKTGMDCAESVYKTLSEFWKRVSPSAAEFTRTLYGWYKSAICAVISLLLLSCWAGMYGFFYIYVMVSPSLVRPLVTIGYLICLKVSNFFISFGKTKELEAEYEEQVYDTFVQCEFKDQNPILADVKTMIATSPDYKAYKLALEHGPIKTRNSAWFATLIACLKPLLYGCLVLLFVRYASPNIEDLDVKNKEDPFHVDIDKCWDHFKVTDAHLRLETNTPKGWVHSYQACYDCAVTNGTVWTHETAYFECAQNKAHELNDTLHEPTKNEVELEWYQYAWQNEWCTRLGGKWMCDLVTPKSDTPSPPNELLGVTKKIVEELKPLVDTFKEACKEKILSNKIVRVESYLFQIFYFAFFVALLNALAYITLLV